MTKKERVLVIVAHPDDEIIGCGGSIAKYAMEGKEVITVIFSAGDIGNSPWLKGEYLAGRRREEAKKIGDFIGSGKTIFFNLKDQNLEKEVETKKVKLDLTDIIKKYKPNSIFTHSKHDAHRDHRAVNKVVFDILYKVDPKKKLSVYTFEVWNILKDTKPIMYVNVSDTFGKKIEAMKKFKSQTVWIYILLIPVVIRAFICGLHARCRFAERFYKIR